LVNVSSIFGLVAPPNTGAYCVSKFAVRGYTETLRSELEGSNVQVSCVHPGVIATNIAVAADAPADMVQQFAARGLSPERAARQILKGVKKGKARVLITQGAYLLDWLQRLTPAHYRPLMFTMKGLKQEQ
jgi:short-subunit dehydrogenase